jgi:hypothetical protein
MAENKRYEITARFKSRTEEAKRVMYTFEDPEDPDKERKFSAFQPNLPQLIIGCTYHFTVEDVPTGDGKFYHNLARDGRDGPYLIAKADKQLPPKPVPASELPGAPKSQAQTSFGADNYWRNKDQRDVDAIPYFRKKDAEEKRGKCLMYAFNYYQDVMVRARSDKGPSEKEVQDLAERFEKWMREAEA